MKKIITISILLVGLLSVWIFYTFYNNQMSFLGVGKEWEAKLLVTQTHSRQDFELILTYIGEEKPSNNTPLYYNLKSNLMEWKGKTKTQFTAKNIVKIRGLSCDNCHQIRKEDKFDLQLNSKEKVEEITLKRK